MPHPSDFGASATGLALAFVTCLGLLGAAPAAAAITGVCPDGSIFIVQSADAIPCRNAKRVDPSDVPPLQPELLPRPYGWERFNRRADPNNPYNVVGEATPGALPPVAPPAPAPSPGLAPPPPRQAPAPAPPQLAALPPARGPALGLTPSEVRDLDEIVGLMQSVAPATVARHAPDGSRQLFVQLARSGAFEARLHAALAPSGAAGGPVVLFRAEALDAGPFHGNLTFVQGHIAFHPDPENPAQFGLLDGGLGTLSPGQRVLGYTVLPPHLDPKNPLDIYWNDRRITATLAPQS